jgi:hypothetical protein
MLDATASKGEQLLALAGSLQAAMRLIVDLQAKVSALEAAAPVAGPQGPVGPAGPSGAQGAPGPAGASVKGAWVTEDGRLIVAIEGDEPRVCGLVRGQAGAPGERGPAGERGPPGIDGAAGARGADGRDGRDGRDGLHVVSAEVADGALVLRMSNGDGIRAGVVVGPQGERGERGERGDVGPQGEIGPQGPVGAQGPRGERGERGSAGERGPQGERGEDGHDGSVVVLGDATAAGLTVRNLGAVRVREVQVDGAAIRVLVMED